MRDLIRTIRDLSVNVVLIAHERIVEGDELIIEPAIGGKTTNEIMAECDIVAYCRCVTDDDGHRYLGQLTEVKGRRAKDRSGALGDFAELDVTDWLETFKAALALDTDDLPFTDEKEKV